MLLLKKDIMYITIYKTTLIWFKNIVPNLLPMFIISSLIINTNLININTNSTNNIIYKDEYDREILERDEGALYKIIEIIKKIIKKVFWNFKYAE